MADFFSKDPQEVLDYTFDWSEWLGLDTISTSAIVVDSGLVEDSESNTTTAATVWLSGGTAGALYAVTNTIDTAAGRTAERTLYIRVESR